jgi:streptomycin 6-kinase
MREDPVELMQGDPHERSRRLAALTGLDETAIWEWGAVERVSTALVLTGLGLEPIERQMLEAAELAARLR